MKHAGRRSLLALVFALLAPWGLLTALSASADTPRAAGTSATAEAAVSCSPNHCYGLVRLFRSVGNGIKMYLGVTHLEHGKPADEIATAEMWLGLADGKNGWVELGQIYGVWCNPRRQFFSAATTTTAFSLHCEGTASNTPTKTPIRIQHGASANKWNIYINSQYTGTTYTTSANTSSGADAGSETSIATAAVNTAATNLAYMRSDGTWSTTGWDGAVFGSGAPYTTTWITQPHSYLVKANQISAPATAGSWRGPVDPVTEAVRLAGLNGVTASTRGGTPPMEIVHSTREAANQALGQTVRGDDKVTVVQFEGNVVGHRFPHPPGTQAPSGRYLVLVMDSASGSAIDVMIRDVPANLAQLGTVTTTA